MKYGMADIDWKYIGAQMAHADDNSQADFINSFVDELYKACDSEYAVGFQLAGVSQKLTPKNRDTIIILGPENKV